MKKHCPRCHGLGTVFSPEGNADCPCVALRSKVAPLVDVVDTKGEGNWFRWRVTVAGVCTYGSETFEDAVAKAEEIRDALRWELAWLLS